MGLTIRPSNPTLANVGRVLAANRDPLVRRWASWIGERLEHAPHIKPPTVERQLALLVDILVEMGGPLRRQVAELWFDACEFYGETAAARGLAAGEVVEEIQHLRELLIRALSDVIAALPARHSMAAVLRLNRQVDKGIAHAVVGYTDALVQTLFADHGVPIALGGPEEDAIVRRLEQLEAELRRLRDKSA
ncbi:MAG: hypothetical protein A2W29_06225 [Gemmatimonadetes bacterium RBG_16_66_8]|nr:MAG: hypothetical protein A2W29_06225 [Gemmatimonadetes bacterium RBG_16_66_8]